MTISERVILGQINEALDDHAGWLKHGWKIERAFKWGSALVLLAAIALERFTPLDGTLCVMLGAVGGVLLGISGYIRLMHNIWPHLAPHIDRRSLTDRLARLEITGVD